MRCCDNVVEKTKQKTQMTKIVRNQELITTQELPCRIRVAANPWPMQMATNITSKSWPQGALFLWGLHGGKGYVTSLKDTWFSLFSFLHAPAATPMSVAKHWLVAELILPSQFSG